MRGDSGAEELLKFENVHKESVLVDEKGDRYVSVRADLIVRHIDNINIVPEETWRRIKNEYKEHGNYDTAKYETVGKGKCEPMRWFEQIDKSQNTTMPKRATRNSAGYDICASEECVIEPGKKTVIHTNIRAHMNSDEVLLIYPRSSYGIKRDLMLANQVGVIDADYKDEILICYRNMGTKTAYIAHGDRVAQGVFTKYLKTKDDDTTEVRIGGIGSTGE